MINFILSLINLIHFLVIIFVVVVPFTDSTFLLTLHSFIVPFIMFHWLLNNDTCAITLIEKEVRRQMNGGGHVEDFDCFSYKVIGPVYNFMNDNYDYSTWTWTTTIVLWLVTLYKLNIKYQEGKLQKFFNS